MNYGLNGIFYGVKIFAALAFVLLSADRFGRSATLMVGAPFMAVFQIITAVLLERGSMNGGMTSISEATVAFMCLFAIAYNFSWGPLSFIYVNKSNDTSLFPLLLPFLFPPFYTNTASH